MIKSIITRLTCKHEKWLLVDQFYGDEINHLNGFRSLWRCKHCGKRAFSYRLNELRKKP